MMDTLFLYESPHSSIADSVMPYPYLLVSSSDCIYHSLPSSSRSMTENLSWIEALPKAKLLAAMHELLDTFPAALPVVLQYRPEERDSDLKPPQRRVFDMGKYRERKVALQLQYDGSQYFGFAAQAPGDCEETVEKHLFAALKKVCLIQDRQSCGYSRCGRTDRGVSALGQVVALHLRSAFPRDLPNDRIPIHPNDPYIPPLVVQSSEESTISSTKSLSPKSNEIFELNYCQLLNRVLPPDIRVLGWSEVSEQFSARFSSTYRAYRF